MNPVLLLGGILVVLLLLAVWSKRSSPAATPTGGVAISDSPAADKPIPQTGTSAAVSSTQPVIHPSVLVKRIKIVKDTSSLTDAQGQGSDNSDWRTFQVAEVFAYAGDKMLTAADYSDATLTPVYGDNSYPASNAIDGNPNTFSHTGSVPNVGMLTLTLKNATTLTSIHVLNRQDCCWGRLAGAKIILEDASANVVWSGTLSVSRDVQIFPVTV